jgi:hypothetical protein
MDSMGEAGERLTRLVEAEERYDISFDDLRDAQVAALDERFQEHRTRIKLVEHRAGEAGVTRVRSRDDVVRLLLPHTAYKRDPESWLVQKRWDRMSRWLDTVSAHRVPVDAVSKAEDVDDWIDRLAQYGFFVSCSSGTTGKSAMLVASGRDMNWCRTEAVATYSWGSGVQPLRDRRIFGMAPVAHVARNVATGEAYTLALQDPNFERFEYPVPPITVGALTQMVVLRKAIADGTAKPEDIAAFDRFRPHGRNRSTRPSASRHRRWSRRVVASCMSRDYGRASTPWPGRCATWDSVPRTFTRRIRSTSVAA